MYHKPALLNETIEGMNIPQDGICADLTFGGGGHTRAILDVLGGEGKLFAFDQDADAWENAPEDDRFVLIKQNFRYLKNFLAFHQGLPVDAILADLGVSSHQFDAAERGFSIRFDARLDLRMDKNAALDAHQIVNEYEAEDLARILWQYGELKNSRKIASEILQARKLKMINTTEELKSACSHLAPRGRENKFYAMLFQALRIEVNDELGALKDMLLQSLEVLKPGGRLAVISYHSLEDRLVKNFFKAGNFEGKEEKDFYGNSLSPFRLVTRKPIVPTDEEIAENNRVRSAKLRIAEKRETV